MTLPQKCISLIFLASSFLWAACGNPAGGGATLDAAVAEPAAPGEVAEWTTDHEAALALASEQGKPILVNFTGSDWCPPCMMLKRDVFDTTAFSSYAKENLILLEIDFPMGQKLAPELVEQNEALQETYKIEGFPTLIVLDSQGEETKRTVGYVEGGPSAFISWVEG